MGQALRGIQVAEHRRNFYLLTCKQIGATIGPMLLSEVY